MISSMILLSAAALAEGPPPLPGCLTHLPPPVAEAGAALELRARCEDPARQHALSAVSVFYRPVGEEGWRVAPLRRDASDDAEFIATLPPEVVEPPGVQYFIAEGGDGAEAGAAGDAQEPILVPCYERSERAEGLAERRRLPGGVHDVRLEVATRADRGLHLGLGEHETQLHVLTHARRPLGPSGAVLRDPGIVLMELGPGLPGSVAMTGSAGFIGGMPRAELGFGRLAGLELGLLVGLAGDDPGAAPHLRVRLGPDPGSHLSFQWHRIPGLGYDGDLRLNLDTLPGWPLWVSARVTDVRLSPAQQDMRDGRVEAATATAQAPHQRPALVLSAQARRHLALPRSAEDRHLYLHGQLSYRVRFEEHGSPGWGFGGGLGWAWGTPAPPAASSAGDPAQGVTQSSPQPPGSAQTSRHD